MEARKGQRNGTGVWPVAGNGPKQTDGIGVVAATPESISLAARRFSSGPRMVPIVIFRGTADGLNGRSANPITDTPALVRRPEI